MLWACVSSPKAIQGTPVSRIGTMNYTICSFRPANVKVTNVRSAGESDVKTQ